MHFLGMTRVAGAMLFLLIVGVILLALLGSFRAVELTLAAFVRPAGADDPTGIGPSAAVIVIALMAAIIGVGMLVKWRGSLTLHTEDLSLLENASPDELEARRLETGNIRSAITIAEMDPDGTPLERVIPVGQSVALDEVTVDAIAVEVRQGGGRVTLAIHDPEARRHEMRMRDIVRSMRRPERIDFPVPLQAVVRVEDDVGTRYRVSPFGLGGGGGGTWRADHPFVPAPPATARLLSILIDRLTDAPSMPFQGRRRTARVLEGPWRFDVDV